MSSPSNPLIVQSDMSVLLEVINPLFEEVRDKLSGFAELQKSPEYMHTYKITPLSLWNAASSGITAQEVVNTLRDYAKHEIPDIVCKQIIDYSTRYGKVRLIKENDFLFLECDDPAVMTEICTALKAAQEDRILVSPLFRGQVKQILLKMGYPVMDLAGYDESDSFRSRLKESLKIRPYQAQAAEAFHAGGNVSGGNGVIVLPCGAGKTIVGLAVMEKTNTETLILTTGITALRQWKREILDKTYVLDADVGEYSGEIKEIKPITITTYQTLTQRKNKESPFIHFEVFNKRNWGLIIYDEVHMLPAPVFRITSEIQSKKRLGLTATLIREDGMETEVFSLIGPKKFDLNWKVLERTGFIATVNCYEIRVPFISQERLAYSVADKRNKFRLASENSNKIEVLKSLLYNHRNDNVLIIGQYITQLKTVSQEIGAPIITGATKNSIRDQLYASFRTGEIKTIIVSKVANFAIDLPDANVAIEISGTFGSRQEEAQRLGRILRPKENNNTAWFYTLVSDDTTEMDFAANRQLFLTEQGYKYDIIKVDAEDLTVEENDLQYSGD